MLISAAETCYQSLAVEKSIQALIRNQLQKSQVVVIYSKVTLNRVFVHKVAKKKKKPGECSYKSEQYIGKNIYN